MPTIYEIAKQIKQPDEASGKVFKNAPSIVKDMTPKPFDVRPGLRQMSPEQMLSVEIPVVGRENGVFRGFQREFKTAHARKQARAMAAGKVFPEPHLSVIEGGRVVCNDGQHRLVAAVMNGQSLRVIVTKRSEAEAKQLFSDQGKGMTVDPNTLVLSGDDPFSEYVQDAITGDTIWSPLVGQTGTDRLITPAQMLGAVQAYVTSAMKFGKGEHERAVFDPELADEMGVLVSAFGTKESNPLAFSSKGLRAISATAVLVVRRTGRHKRDIDRWVRWMPQFPFGHYQHLRRATELTDVLLAHWNKKLAASRRVRRIDA